MFQICPQPQPKVQRRQSAADAPSASPSSSERQALLGASYADGVAALSPVQAKGALEPAGAQAIAEAGTMGSGGKLPHFDRIQASFGRHDVSPIQAYGGSAAAEACQAMGAQAYAHGNATAFASSPDLHTAAHEAAHVVQQRAGVVQLKGGVGQAGDVYEQHADAVADAVVAGKSAEPILDEMVGGASGSATAAGVQRKMKDFTGDGDTISANGKTLDARVIAACQGAVRHARVNALAYGQSVNAACVYFDGYVKPKLSALDGDISAGDLLSGIVGGVMGPVGGKIASKITEAWAKKAFEKGYDLLKDKLKDRVKGVGGDSKKDLQAAIDGLKLDLYNSALNMMTLIQGSITPRADSVIKTVRSEGVRALSSEDETFMLHFLDATTSELDTALEAVGIPSAGTTKAVHLDLVQKMVEKFEFQYVWLTASNRQKYTMGLAEGTGAHHMTRAGISAARGRKARAARSKQLK